ncbi:DUF2269 family protein [Glycomyces harbinensis]|uniref:Predicted integral membrane protein n=1 Tax=Glycomyces harbinensis TaxID=58114 RepID=A0A1G7AFT3_9ACTN|nr:DUF2269 family protein [Glycomyces harbinensis]SDE13317.1 Predicted integral membrane protein [Glycomyces harbinensis]
MTAFLLSVHVLAAILTIGPVAIAASMFPPAWRAAGQDPSHPRKAAVVAVLHRISRVYATIGVLVPVFGVATAASLGVLTDAWLIASMILTAGAAAILIALILPAQTRALAALDDEPADGVSTRIGGRLAMHTGVFNLLWAIVVVLMIYRPGSTTGV